MITNHPSGYPNSKARKLNMYQIETYKQFVHMSVHTIKHLGFSHTGHIKKKPILKLECTLLREDWQLKMYHNSRAFLGFSPSKSFKHGIMVLICFEQTY